MTIAKDIASKLAVASVALAMVFMTVAPAKAADTTEDLQKMINDLLAQVAALSAQTGQGGNSVASGICPYTWTRDLSVGAKGDDVMKLQKFLNGDLDTRVSATGAGSVGAETSFFGPATAAAVSKFQVKYRSETLSPANLVNPTGYFGPASRAKANGICVKDTLPADTSTTTATSTDDSADVTLGGEADLDKYEADDAEDSTIEEGAEDVEVAVFTAEFASGDASISRLDVAFTNASSSAHAWDAFETISLWVDGDKVAEADASSKGDYLGDEDNGIIRFSGLDIVGMEDEELEITVAATIQGNLDTAELSTWTVTTESLRFFDADGVATTDTALVDDETASFDLELAGSDDEALIKTSSNNPAATTLKVETNKKSEDYTVFAFDIDTDDSTTDLDVNEVVLTVDISSSTAYDTIVDDAELTIDGVKITDVTVTNGASTTADAILTFNVDGDVTIEAGERVEAELVLTFKSLASINEGITVTAAVASGAIEVEGADTFTSTGAATGKVHTLRTSGAVLEAGDMTETLKVNSDTTIADDQGTFVVKFDVTAFDQDLYINKSAVHSSSTVNTEGVNFVITNGSGVEQVVVSSTTASLSSDATTESGQYKVSEGETKTFTLTVTYDPAAGGFYAAQLFSLNFKDAAGNPTVWQSALPAEDYETDALSI